MPASNSEARKRHEARAVAVTTDAMAEAITGTPRWYSTYQLECDRCGQTYSESSTSSENAAERHESHCGGEVWSASLAFPYALDVFAPVSEYDRHTATFHEGQP